MKETKRVLHGNTDCYAFQPRKCDVLEEKVCRNNQCKFYKTAKQFMEGIDKYPPTNTDLEEFIEGVRRRIR